MSNKFAGYSDSPSAPSTHWNDVAPSDSVDLADVPKAIYVGVGGDIVMIGANAPTNATGKLWKNVAAGSIIPGSPRRILATGTTATNLLALY